MIMKHRLTAFLLVACLLFAYPPVAYADVLIEPNNDFYSRHSNECENLNRDFFANGKEGFVSLKEEPGSKREIIAVKNGETLHIQFIYNHKGETWGVAELYMPDKPYDQWPTGWVPMDALLLLYDYISFEEEHQDAFYDYTGDYEKLKEADTIILWTWPGSGKAEGALEAEVEDENFGVTYAYKDEEGREWGFVGYWYGYRNVWICLSDPANEEIPASNPPPVPEVWNDSTVGTPQKGIRVTALTIILLVVLIAGTAILIRVFWKPRKDPTAM